jgi:hypothetical protein
VIDPVPLAELTSNFSPIPLIEPPPLGSEIEGIVPDDADGNPDGLEADDSLASTPGIPLLFTPPNFRCGVFWESIWRIDLRYSVPRTKMSLACSVTLVSQDTKA